MNKLTVSVFTGFCLCLLLGCAGKPEGNYTLPLAHFKGVKVEHVMKTEAQCVKMAYDKITKSLWYITFRGDVFRIQNLSTHPFSKKMFSAQEHGISKLQGIAFYDNMLFLCGNYEKGSANFGKMVRYTFGTNDQAVLSTVFTTEGYGTNETTFDHGWNSIAINMNGDYIFVNSGSRTDHGEIQDNKGAWPNSRDVPLTAKIFRIPIKASNMVLLNNKDYLVGNKLIYAQGIRNAYGLAFDSEGELFAASNSGDYDHPEDLFWVQYGKHYGFPWVMGGVENPQQYRNWTPSIEKPGFLSPQSFAFKSKYFINDPKFPRRPANMVFSKSIENVGPDANEFRDITTKEVKDGDTTEYVVTTFTPHSSPVGLTFDRQKTLPTPFKGNGFVLRYSSSTMRNSLLTNFTDQGADLLMLKFSFNKVAENYRVATFRIVDQFSEPVDCVLVDQSLYVIEHHLQKGNIWRIKFG